jgi:hypothetical protein
MSGNNPYAKFLDGRAPEEILAATGAELAALLTVMGPEKSAMSPAPGKWSPAGIVSHLADSELAYGFRLRQILAEENPFMQSFKQDKWATDYGTIPAEEALAAFLTLREWNLRVVRRGLKTGPDRIATHSELGEFTFSSWVEFIAGHDLNHLTQIRRLAGVLPA